MNYLRNEFKGKRIFVTGDTGFKGSWLSLWLYELGAQVVGYALPPKQENALFNLLGLEKIIHHVNADIRDLGLLRRVCDEFQPEFLFHLAAQAIVRLSYQEPKDTFDTNVGGSVNILELVRHSNSLKSVIYVTSDKCYRNKGWLWGYRENDELGGRDPYSASKAAAEIVFSAYLDSFFKAREDLGVASVRAGNVIGGGDWAVDRIIPDCIRSLKDNQSILLRNPKSIRPWQHVLEPLSGYLMLALRLYHQPKQFSGSWNFGPKSESIRTVSELVENVVDCWGKGEIQVKKENDALHEDKFLLLNCDKANQLLNWHPKWNFKETVTKTVDWYKGLVSGKTARESTIQQIKDYMEVGDD